MTPSWKGESLQVVDLLVDLIGIEPILPLDLRIDSTVPASPHRADPSLLDHRL
jgi:hypothetical protein